VRLVLAVAACGAFVVVGAAFLLGYPQYCRNFTAFAASSMDSAQQADLILTNGNIYTGDATTPRAEALAIRGETIIAVGSASEVRKTAGKSTIVIDLRGQFVMPGFNDAHVHIGEAGRAKLLVNLVGAASLPEFQRRIRESLPTHKPGTWITGFGWDHTLWPQKQFPTRADLDAVASDRPMFFKRVDGHVAVANSASLKIAGITRETPDPPGGHIEHDATTGEPNGILEEDTAMALVAKLIPPPSAVDRMRGISLALADAAHDGVTSVQDNSAWDDFLVFQELRRAGGLPVRITEWLPFNKLVSELEELRRQGGTTDAWLKTGMLKGFLDGSLGSRTAALLAPYSDDPSTSGILLMDSAAVARMAVERDAAGFQIGFHAIGDHANRVALDAFAAVLKANGPRDRRDRIEHAQVIAPEDFPRFAELSVIASMQPSHETTDMRWAQDRLGAERSKGAYAWNTLQRGGVRLAFGTDYPIESINPMRGLHACVTRALPDGTPAGGWQPQEKISIEDCIRAYTYGSAYVQFDETRKGVLAPGRLADVVSLSQDVTGVPPGDILKTQVEWTMTGGRFVYQRAK